jgi:hypothetical protein
MPSAQWVGGIAVGGAALSFIAHCMVAGRLHP